MSSDREFHQGRVREAIAIVGIGCRFQDVNDVTELWELVRGGRVAFREVPPDRFDIDRYYDPTPRQRGRIVTREGGYLRDVWAFDNALFGISHREASAMDPQHRVLLEVGYQALADAALPLAGLAGSRTAVHVGMFTSDFRDRVLRHAGVDLDVYVEIGTTRSSAAGRLAHAFDLVGPATTVDAACASSLVAVHQACEALWLGGVDLALAGGCNLVLEPEATICFSQSGMLSPSSRCQFGDASADGFVRSDGAGLVVLKRLSDAIRDGDRVYATIVASGVANDGRQGDGLFMTPSVEGQRGLLERVYHSQGLDPARLVYMEAHGTGTPVGDPVETRAVAEALSGQRDDPLWIGSVKTNLGHTEGAAGIAGLIRAALTLHHREITPSLHLTVPNPDIPWDEGHLAVARECVPLPADDTMLAGVSAFGLSGTNAHVVLGVAPGPEPIQAAIPELWQIPVYAHHPDALHQRAADLALAVARCGPEGLADLACSARRSTAHRYRGLAVGANREEIQASLEALAERPAVTSDEGGAVFVFPGQGGQWPRMGATLLRHSASFGSALRTIDATFGELAGWSVVEALSDPDAAWTRRIDHLQPTLVAYQIAVARMWQALGVEPVAVVGHSLGEVSAAAISGGLSLEDAVRVVLTRSELLARIAGAGAMAVVAAAEAEVSAALESQAGRAVVAVVNASASTVVSGDPEAVDAVVAAFEARGTFARRVRVDVASHSPQVEPLVPELRRMLADLRPRDAAIPMMSTVDADWIDGGRLNAGYWARNLRQPVRFLQASRALSEHAGRFVECGPHPVLTGPLKETLQAAGRGSTSLVVPSAHREAVADEIRRQSLADLFASGVPVDLERTQPPGRIVTLPRYPFQRERFELPVEVDAQRERRTGGTGHPWLTRSLRLASEPSVQVWQVSLAVRTDPWLDDHRVRGTALFPGAGFAELARAAGQLALGDDVQLQDVELIDYLTVPDEVATLLQIQLRTLEDGAALVAFHSFDEGGGLRQHATARLIVPSDDSADAPRALLEERLALEHARSRRNPGHVYGLLEVTLSATDDPDGAGLSSHRIGRSLRGSDAVFAIGPDRVVVVASVAHPEQLQVVARRLRGALQGGDPDRGWIGDVAFRGCAVVPADAPVSEVSAHIDRGLPLIVVAEEEGPASVMPGVQLYDDMRARGIEYGPTFRGVQAVRRRQGVASADLVIPDGVLAELARQPMHAAFLDTCFQAAVASFLDGCDERDGFLPVGLQRLQTYRRPTQHVVCHAWHRGQPTGRDDEIVVDFIVLDDEGRPVLSADGLRVRRFTRQVTESVEARVAGWMFHSAWAPAAAAECHADPRPWLVVGDAAPLAAALDAPMVSDVKQSLDSLPPGPAGVVVVCEPGDDATTSCLALLDVMHGIAGRARSDGVQLWVVSRGAWRMPGDASCTPGQAAVWGLARVLANEASEVSPKLVDTDALDAPALAALIRANGTHDESAVRGGDVWRRTLAAGRPQATQASTRAIEPDDPATVSFEPVTQALSIRRDVGPEVSDDHLMVSVEAVTWSQLGPARSLVGLAGRIRGIGSDCGPLRVGQRIVALLPGLAQPHDARQVGRHVAIPADRVVRIQEDFDAALACQLAAHWLPAMAALRGLCPGERVFVADAGAPVAQAAAWLATQREAVVVAAAHGLAARSALRECGIDFVLDMHAPDLCSVARDLAGDRFDRVLDLAGALPAPTLELMLTAGSELVVGQASRATYRGEASLQDLSREVHDDPGRQVAALRTLVFGPHGLPTLWGHADVLAPESVPDASWPSWSVTLDQVPVSLEDTTNSGAAFDPRGVYVITGGTGGLGLRLAAWLGRRGAGHVVLVSRSGRVRPADALAFEAVTASGAEVHVTSCDVSHRASVQETMSAVCAIGPVRGVFHLAGVLRDATWQHLDADRFAAVMAPKVDGARNLHLATMDLPLDHFVLFSSAATTVGSPGQGNYAAANAVLDSLAHHRRSLGLPATSIGWGAWSETGLAAVDKNRGARLETRGLRSMAPADALEALGQVLRGGHPEVAVFDMDWERWARTMPSVVKRPSVSGLVPEPEETPIDREGLEAAIAAGRTEVVLEELRGLVSQVTRLPVARIDPRTGLAALGLDSLMAVELRAGIHERFGVELSPRRLLALPDLNRLAECVMTARQRQRGEVSGPRTMHDARLPASIRATAPRGSSSGDVFLTGATGFVGAHLLRDLLDRTERQVICLVRAGSVEEGRERLVDALRSHGLHRPGDGSRIEVLVGDLSEPRIGLPAAEFEVLAHRIGTIHHCGAWVNHVYDYATLAPANVDGTIEVLRLAATGPVTPVHYVSTVAVFPFTTVLDREVTYTESTPLGDACEPFFGGYAESKWAAERLCAEANRRGIPVTVYRLGAVTGSHAHAACPTDDAVWRIVHAMATLGRVPDFRSGLAMTPVDYVSQAIVHLSQLPDVAGQAFHLFGGTSIGVAELADALHRVGISVSDVDKTAWRASLAAGVDRSWPAAPLVPRLTSLDVEALDQARITVDGSQAVQRLPDAIVALSHVDAILLTAYLQGMVADGFLPVPRDVIATPMLSLGGRRDASPESR